MKINGLHQLVKEEHESFRITFDGANIANPKVQEGKRALVIHAPTSGSVAGAVATIKESLKRDPRFSFTVHLVVGRDGKQIVQTAPFDAGANHADDDYNKRSIGMYLEYPGEVVKDEEKVRLEKKYPGITYILASPLNSSRYGTWPLYPREQLDTLLTIAQTLKKPYRIKDTVARDEILTAAHPGPAFPIVQFREKLLGVNDRSMLLQETAHSIQLRGRPEKESKLLSEIIIPKGTPVSIINERFRWYLISVVEEVGGNPWLIGWVEKTAIRVNAKFKAVVRKDHYLVTSEGRRFQEIKPHPNGYQAKKKNPKPKFIIMHVTTGNRMESTINHFKDPGSRVSTHLLIGRDGRVVQFLPFDRIAHHAGDSWWEQLRFINNYSIGIELDNAGLLRRRQEDGAWIRRDFVFEVNQVMQAVHLKQYIPKDPKDYPGWEIFPQAQLDVALNIVKALTKRYKSIKEILGHDDVNLKNRYDPGPREVFPLDEFRRKLFGQKDPIIDEYVINQRTDIYGNFRGRIPNTKQRIFDVPLPANSLVKVMAERDEFALVSVIKSKDPRVKATGWIQLASLEDPEKRKGKKGGKNKKKGDKASEKRRTTIPQVFFRKGDDSPTPKLDAGPFNLGTRVRIQEFRGDWALVVLLDRVSKNGPALLEGWMPRKFLSRKSELPKLIAANKMTASGQIPSVPVWQFLPSDNPREAAKKLDTAPDVVILSEGMGRVTLTREWQLFLVALNPNMKKNHISALLGSAKAFANKSGFPAKPGDPPRQNWIMNAGLNNNSPLPELDKDRSCAFNYCTGTPSGKHLIVATLDGKKPPPDITQVNPITHPWFFFHATTVEPAHGGKPEIIRPFPHGAPAWGINQNVVFFPLVATHEIRYPLDRLHRLEPFESIDLPYRPLPEE